MYDARYDKRPENHLAAVVKLVGTNLNGAISKSLTEKELSEISQL
ncbi:hypothetical protein SF83666_a45400 (plasmid) [Sinorhizobium fredii CCBAU 83666]|nr:hypothetical protein SF83666_a45400 [Sinorhizobium fredii CCBAU 83666]